MSFLNPTYLWALLGLLVPIIIHLWSNKSGKTIKVGSTQFLTESESSRSSSIRLNELLLLLFRMVIIALLALILAEPVWTTSVKNKAIVYLVEPSLTKEPKVKLLLDTISESETIRMLSVGFPEYEEDESYNSEKTPNYWQLAQQFNSLQADSIVVYTRALTNGLLGSRPTIEQKVSWITIPSEAEKSEQLLAYKSTDSITVFTSENDDNTLIFNKKRLGLNSSEVIMNASNDSLEIANKTIPVFNQATINILIYDDASSKNNSKFIVDALEAIKTYLNHPINLEVSDSYSENEKFEVLIWNSLAPIPPVDKTLLYFSEDALANELIKPTSVQNQYRLTKVLNSENSIDQHLTEQLLALLKLNNEAIEVGKTYDNRTVSAEQLTTGFKKFEEKKQKQANVGIAKWFWFLLVPLLISERVLSKFRKQ